MRALVITPFARSAGLGRLDPEWIGILSQKVCGAGEVRFGEAESAKHAKYRSSGLRADM